MHSYLERRDDENTMMARWKRQPMTEDGSGKPVFCTIPTGSWDSRAERFPQYLRFCAGSPGLPAGTDRAGDRR
ncbi:MAG: hypothetical protein ACLU9S_01805 [Oscillospiraceae bacterium]